MDQFVLIAVAGDLDRSLRGATLVEFRQESIHRFRAVFVRGGRGYPLTLSVRPERPWVGRPSLRPRVSRTRTTAFASEVHRHLHDRVVEEVDRIVPGRVLRFGFVGGRALIVELAPHGANIVVTDDHGAVLTAAKHPRSSRERLRAGRPYRPPDAPVGALDPITDAVETIDAAVRRGCDQGLDRVTAVRHALLGTSRTTAEALVDLAVTDHVTEGSVARKVAAGLERGDDAPIVEAAFDVGRSGETATLDRSGYRLLPFTPPREPPEGWTRTGGRGAASTAGLFHEMRERAVWTLDRRSGLEAMLRTEIGRLERIARKVERDLARFGDPDAYRIKGEALLAALHSAVREGDRVRVPDPYDPSGCTMTIEVAAGTPLTRAADDLFARHRRAIRGLDTARDRLRTVRTRLETLVDLERIAGSIVAVEELETAMRGAGIAVGLAARQRVRLAQLATGARPRLEGVRMFTSATEAVMLVGKSARDNQHLTFAVAQPEDFWFHALGRTGAHVVVRNPERRGAPDGVTLREAAALAAWYSEGRSDAAVDVQWTRRKYVRKARNGPPGAVLVKKFETVRVAPGHPAGQSGDG